MKRVISNRMLHFKRVILRWIKSTNEVVYLKSIGLLCLVLLLASCAKTIYVPVQAENTSIDSTSHVSDSHKDHEVIHEVERHDSVVYIYTDSVITIREYHMVRDYTYEQKLLAMIDSLSNIKRDTIREPYPIEVVKTEVKMNVFQKLFFWIGICFCVAFALWIVVRFYLKK